MPDKNIKFNVNLIVNYINKKGFASRCLQSFKVHRTGTYVLIYFFDYKFITSFIIFCGHHMVIK